jgi:hypothetical protein
MNGYGGHTVARYALASINVYMGSSKSSSSLPRNRTWDIAKCHVVYGVYGIRTANN